MEPSDCRTSSRGRRLKEVPISSPFASSTNFDDATFAWAAGGGLYIPIRRRSRHPLSLDIGAQYHANGEARYLREGSIHEDGTGEIFFDPIRSQTNLITYRLGITVGL